MNAEICVRCGLPNEEYLVALGNISGYQVTSGTDTTICVRCGLPNEKFRKFLSDHIVEQPIGAS